MNFICLVRFKSVRRFIAAVAKIERNEEFGYKTLVSQRPEHNSRYSIERHQPEYRAKEDEIACNLFQDHIVHILF